MEKSLIIKIVVVAIALLFITELFYLGGGINLGGPSVASGENITGTIIFNGTIRTYDPLLVLPTDTNQSLIEELRIRDAVVDIKTEADGIIVETETRDDVYPLAQYLRGLGVNSLSIANIVTPQTLQLETQTGNINISGGSGAVRVITEPLLESESEVTVELVGTASNGQLISYSSANILLETITLVFDAVVNSLNHKTYSYNIPWEERNSLGDLSQFAYYEYDKVDSIVFTQPLTINQIQAKKQFPYITYIDGSSAQVLASFNNRTQIQENFQDVQVAFPSSALKITTNQDPEYSFDSVISYNYNLTIIENDSSNYELETLSLEMSTDSEQEINSTVQLSIESIVLGKTVISIQSVQVE